MDFLKLLYHSKCLIGNSSVGIRECAFLGVPVVNIGSRQSGRERGKNVIDVDYNRQAIYDAISQHIHDKRPISDHLYGNGAAGIVIANEIAKWHPTFDKKILY